MGLDTSHGCWHGAYGAFMRWRQEIAKAAGLPPLELMEGFFTARDRNVAGAIPTFFLGNTGELAESSIKSIESRLPIKWDCLKPSPLHELLWHSDCEGEIPLESCQPIADALEAILPNLPVGNGGGHIGDWREKTQAFIDGLRAAHSANESVSFH